jgi:redox-sensitive bicupin YhaK (pirin superfamily)
MDSIGSDQLITAGQLGVMTAGRGIAHSEQSPVAHPAQLHGVQLWVALPEGARHAEPAWQHEEHLPRLSSSAMEATVFVGELADAVSPATTFSPIVGADITLTGTGDEVLVLQPDFEYGVIVMDGGVLIDGVRVNVGSFLYLGHGRHSLRFGPIGARPARMMLLGGEPFGEEIVMWWNFVARDTDEIAVAREQWAAGDERFGGATPVAGYAAANPGGPVTAAPPMPTGRLKPSGGARQRKA